MVVSEKTKRILRRLVFRTIDGLYRLSILGAVFVCVQVFLFASFRIPSNSMAPGLHAGDRVLVCKPIYGARLFHLFDAINGERVTIYRLPGIRKVKRNDVAVFHFPYPNRGDKIEMHLMKYYIKRCIGLPGDTLLINNGIYRVKGFDKPVGNVESQQKVAIRQKASFEEGVYRTFPQDSVFGWNIKDFGPLHIPKKGDVLAMNRTHYLLYRKLIEWEQNATLEYKDSLVYMNSQAIASYQFQKN
jgi:signal peptidase I